MTLGAAGSVATNTLRGFARFITDTDSSSFTDAQIDGLLNHYYHFLINEIIASMDQWDVQGQIATTDLVVDQEEYPFPSDALKIKRIEITYDGTNWYEVRFIDYNERSKPFDTTSISNDFDKTSPYAEIFANSIFLRPIPDIAVSAALKIYYEEEITELSATTDEPNLMEAYQKGLCYGSAKDYFSKIENEKKSTEMENNLEKVIARMKLFYGKHIQDNPPILKPAWADYEF